MDEVAKYLLRQMVRTILDNTRWNGGPDDPRSATEIDRVVSLYARYLQPRHPENTGSGDSSSAERPGARRDASSVHQTDQKKPPQDGAGKIK